MSEKNIFTHLKKSINNNSYYKVIIILFGSTPQCA